jgi:L-alanine-DL-glutamate epimerase-like enolase superfamily enzyme
MGLGLREMLLGADPLDVERIWQRLYVGSAMNGRRGAVICAIGALDLALHDLRGKALGKPAYEQLGEPVQSAILPYASLQPETGSFSEYRDSLVEWARVAVANGFRAVKSEVTLAGPYAHRGMREPWERSTEVVAAVRNAVGPDVDLLVDVQYAFPDCDTALSVMADWEGFNLSFVEAPLWPDDLDGLRRLTSEQPIPIASGEWLTTRFEHLDLMDRAGVQVIQPDLTRVGGLTEAQRVCALAADRGLRIVPHVWKTEISISAAVHLAAVNPNCPYIEFLPSDLSESPLRKTLTNQQLQMADGRIPLPTSPGLGIELNRDVLEEFRREAERVVAARRRGA